MIPALEALELVFDQGLGALFVIRVAGKIVAPSQVGSRIRPSVQALPKSGARHDIDTLVSDAVRANVSPPAPG